VLKSGGLGVLLRLAGNNAHVSSERLWGRVLVVELGIKDDFMALNNSVSGFLAGVVVDEVLRVKQVCGLIVTLDEAEATRLHAVLHDTLEILELVVARSAGDLKTSSLNLVAIRLGGECDCGPYLDKCFGVVREFAEVEEDIGMLVAAKETILEVADASDDASEGSAVGGGGGHFNSRLVAVFAWEVRIGNG
jgi:hypothetical protein